MIEWITTFMLLLLVMYVGNNAFELQNTANQMRDDRSTRGKAFLAHEEWKMKPAPKQLLCQECEITAPSNGNCFYCRKERGY